MTKLEKKIEDILLKDPAAKVDYREVGFNFKRYTHAKVTLSTGEVILLNHRGGQAGMLYSNKPKGKGHETE